MKKIDQNILESALSYKAYRELTNELLEQGKTTGNIQNEEMLNYTRMNVARMNRLDKTTKLTEQTLANVAKISKPTTWLIITEAWCGDAAQIIPVIQKIADHNELINVRLILRDENLEVMDAFLTNGSRSIPIIIAIDSTTNEVLGSWGPRPSEVQAKVMDTKVELDSLSDKEKRKELYQGLLLETQRWYNKDKTKKIQSEFAETLLV